MKFECPNCKKTGAIDEQKIPEVGVYATCPNCNERFLVKKSNDFEFEPVTKPPTQQKTEINKLRRLELSGVGGWLKFIIISMMYIGPFLTLSIVADIYDAQQLSPDLVNMDSWGYYKYAIHITILTYSLLSIYGGWSLKNNRSKLAVKKAIIILWILGPLYRLTIELILPLVIFGNLSASESTIIAHALGSCIIPLIATLYLLKSIRVQNTYNSETSSISFDSETLTSILIITAIILLNITGVLTSVFGTIFKIIGKGVAPFVELLPTSPPELSGNTIHVIGISFLVVAGYIIYNGLKD